MKQRIVLLALLILMPGLVQVLEENQINLLVLSKFFGTICLSTFCIILILGCRSYCLNQFFGSLSLSFRLHHYLTFVFFITIFLHVIFYAAIYFSMEWELGFQSLLDFESPSIVIGWAGFFIVFIVFFFSYLKKWSHGLWLKIHRIFILGFIISVLHIRNVFFVSEGGTGIILAIFLAITLVVLVMHYFFPRYLRRFSNYIVDEVKTLNDQTTEITLRPESQQIMFEPGQFVYISIKCNKGCGVSHNFHPFTLDSNPLIPGSLCFAVRGLGEDTKKLIHIVPGNQAVVEGPYGNLLQGLKPQCRQLWIAGGIGVTPFISYIRRWKSTLESLPSEGIILLLFLKKKSDHVFSAELAGIQGLKVIVFYDEINGVIDSAKLKSFLPSDLRNRAVIVSGPIKMIKFFKNELYQLGIRNLKTEEFDF